MNEAIQRFVDELAADPAVRGSSCSALMPAAMRDPTATQTW